MRTKGLGLLCGISPVLIFGAATLAAPVYSITPLANDGTDCYIKGVNDAGTVVGWTVDADGNEHAAFWDSTGQHPLAGLTATPGSRAYGISNSGQIVGQAVNDAGNRQATLWNTATPGTASPLSSLGAGSYSSAFGINQNGNIVGTGKAAHGQHAIVWDTSGNPTDYGSFNSSANLQIAGFNCINDSGVMGGTAYYLLDPYKATTGRLGTLAVTDISVPQRVASESLAINNNGTIVGYSGAQPVIFNGDHTVQNLGLMGYDQGQAEGIDDAGDIVGRLYRFNDDGSVDQVSFLYTGGQMYNLMDLVGAKGGWTTLFEASAINEHGDIVGVGIYNGEVHGFVLSQVPEPTTLAAIPLLGVLLRRRRA